MDRQILEYNSCVLILTYRLKIYLISICSVQNI